MPHYVSYVHHGHKRAKAVHKKHHTHRSMILPPAVLGRLGWGYAGSWSFSQTLSPPLTPVGLRRNLRSNP